MKFRYRLTLLVLFLSSFSVSTSYAKIWRVNNRGVIPADFTSAQAAHDGANPGDTIFLEPSPTNYGNLTVSKKLIVIGTGYFLAENLETQWKNNWPAILGSVTFDVFSDYSQLMGTICGSLQVSAPYITIRRNYINDIIQLSASNIVVLENYCDFLGGYGCTTISFLKINSGFHDISINNNIFIFHPRPYTSGAGVGDISGSVSYAGGFLNNIIMGYLSWNCAASSSLNLENFIVQNNIISTCTFYQNNNYYTNNICNNTEFGNQNGNQENVDLNTVFLYTGSTDGQYQLKTGSPAIGAGFGGVDCGAFGGLNPYILSGIPPIPAIYDFNIGSANNQYNVQLKVKAHN